MTLNATVAGPFEFVEAEIAQSEVAHTEIAHAEIAHAEIASADAANTERRDVAVFFGFSFALVGSIVLAAMTVGLGGVGMIAIVETAAMIGVCVLLTAG
ncbi:hypothetical protein CCR94_04075 [Rhodoblastus sphagnicola]|uniref:Uncharacterized protein n=1 Tax=Rhodoblastus sphagnicola TaxID=333368 RepID=A0A2S6NDY7_9HYPH|nr:hypothetical protein [Rhodoblastus sphagnicola]MBB4198453.1 hypothetical protein [Rhodoblastus sphagnicola]PPQ32821.1 hypothetical protein CCR94_04075 [Rhodoblastus sphagnicola]